MLFYDDHEKGSCAVTFGQAMDTVLGVKMVSQKIAFAYIEGIPFGDP